MDFLPNLGACRRGMAAWNDRNNSDRATKPGCNTAASLWAARIWIREEEKREWLPVPQEPPLLCDDIRGRHARRDGRGRARLAHLGRRPRSSCASSDLATGNYVEAGRGCRRGAAATFPKRPTARFPRRRMTPTHRTRRQEPKPPRSRPEPASESVPLRALGTVPQIIVRQQSRFRRRESKSGIAPSARPMTV